MNARSVGRNVIGVLRLSRQWGAIGRRSCSASAETADKARSGGSTGAEVEEIVKKELYFDNQVLRLILNDPKKR